MHEPTQDERSRLNPATATSKTFHVPARTYQATCGTRYQADVNGSLRKIDAGRRLTKAEKKAAKRARRRSRG
jgi:hypothetical protein